MQTFLMVARFRRRYAIKRFFSRLVPHFTLSENASDILAFLFLLAFCALIAFIAGGMQ